MSDLVPFESAKVPAALRNVLGADANNDLSAGVSGGFSVLSFRGSKWRVKHSGEEHLLTNSEGDARSSVTAVILKANRNISKNYYEGGYVEGSADTPSCWSVDGIKPDAAVEKPVSPSCANCPKNQFGSRITDSGSKAKACSDNRRIAIVPEGDYANENFGGPMLLRVPAASLSDLAMFGKAMSQKGYPYNTIVTRISFDPDTSYPKLKFKAVRPLKEDEAEELVGLLQDESYKQKIDFILAQATEIDAAADAAPAAKADDPTEFEVPVTKAEPKPAAQATPKAAAKKKEPEPVKEATADLDQDLDDILAKLDDLD